MSNRKVVISIKQKEFLDQLAKEGKTCPHTNERFLEDAGFNSPGCKLFARVVCLDCGHEREWDAY